VATPTPKAIPTLRKRENKATTKVAKEEKKAPIKIEPRVTRRDILKD